METNNRQENIKRLGNLMQAHLLKIEIAAVLFFLIGLGLKIDSNPAANIILTITLTTLAGVYYVTAFSFMELDAPTSVMEAFGTKLTSFGLCIATVGILFKIQSWPGSDPMLVVAAFVMLFWIGYNVIKTKKYRVILRPAVFLIMILGLKLTPKEKLEKYNVINVMGPTIKGQTP